MQGVVGGVVGAGMLQIIEKAIANHGGVGGLVQQFEKNGLGGVAQSWVASGPNKAVTPDQISKAFGPDTIKKLATGAGMAPKDLVQQLAEHLPGVVDKMTPNGKIAA
jgi:uncharacterized protein YidB (DUF937 family)